MFSAYMIAQNKLQNVECRKRTKTCSVNDSSMQRSHGHMHDDNGSSLSSASASKPSSVESLLLSDKDGEDDFASGSENDDDGGVYLEAHAAAASIIQYQGRRAPVQDALIHRLTATGARQRLRGGVDAVKTSVHASATVQRNGRR